MIIIYLVYDVIFIFFVSVCWVIVGVVVGICVFLIIGVIVVVFVIW